MVTKPMGEQSFHLDPTKNAYQAYDFSVITPKAEDGCHYESVTGAPGQKVEKNSGTFNKEYNGIPADGTDAAHPRVIPVSFKKVCASQEYSINYKFNGKTISSQTGSALVGSSVAYKLPKCEESKYCTFAAADGKTSVNMVYNKINYDVDLKVVLPDAHKYVFHYKTLVDGKPKTMKTVDDMLRIGEKHEFAPDLKDIECPFDNCAWVSVDGNKFYEAPYANEGANVDVMIKAVDLCIDKVDGYTYPGVKECKASAEKQVEKAKTTEEKKSAEAKAKEISAKAEAESKAGAAAAVSGGSSAGIPKTGVGAGAGAGVALLSLIAGAAVSLRRKF